MLENIKLSSPWAIYFRQVQALFAEDSAVKVVFDENANELKIYVEGASKAEAIEKLLPTEKTFGNVVMKITVIPANNANEDKLTLISKAFEGNPALSDIISTELFDKPISYVLFRKEVVQYFNDDLSDAHGICSTLYQDLAKEVFGESEGIFFCTEVSPMDEGIVGKPLGEWP
jgi:hypothetical protein